MRALTWWRCFPFLSLLLLVGCGSDDEGVSEEPIVVDRGTGAEDGTGEPVEEPDEPSAPPNAGSLVVGADPCETDADCRPAACCHAAACVAADQAPDCSETMCTADCQFGTIDCGGGCLCHEGRCAARLSEPPDLETVE